jgi:hypothetical protein
MAGSLATYLNDHLAGAMFATELLEHMREAHADGPLGRVASKLLDEIRDDRTVLQEIRDQAGGDPTALKEASAWLAEKAARLKLRLRGAVELGEFEAMEALCLGILGKYKLWTALAQIVPAVPQLARFDFGQLADRALAQHDELEAYRLQAAKTALAPAAER